MAEPIVLDGAPISPLHHFDGKRGESPSTLAVFSPVDPRCKMRRTYRHEHKVSGMQIGARLIWGSPFHITNGARRAAPGFRERLGDKNRKGRIDR